MDLSEQSTNLPPGMTRDWWVHILVGFALAIVGVLAIGMPFVTAVTAKLLLGLALLAASVFEAIHAIRMRRQNSVILGLLTAGITLAAGLILITYPVASLFFLTIVLASFLIAVGAVRIVLALELRREVPGWGWYLFGGILSVILGIVIWSGLPGSAVWVIGTLIGVYLIYFGVADIALGLALHARGRGGGPQLAGQH